MILLDEFLALPTSEVAARVQEAEKSVNDSPINGTVSWFLLEHSYRMEGDPITGHMEEIGAGGPAYLATHPDFSSFCSEYDVPVGSHGDYRKALAPTPLADLLNVLDRAACKERTFYCLPSFWRRR